MRRTARAACGRWGLRAWLLVALTQFGIAGCLERKPKGEAQENVAQRQPEVASPAPIKELPARQPSGQHVPNARIAVRLEAEPRHLCPLLSGDAVAAQVVFGDVYEPLLQIAKPGAPATPLLATSISESEDHRTWTIHLREKVSFHDGSRLDADDVIASLQMATEVPGPLRGDFDDLVSATKSGDFEVIVRVAEHRVGRRESFARLPILSSEDLAGVSPKTLSRSTIANHPNGTGPLAFVRAEQGEILLRRAPGYWASPAQAGEILYRVIEERTRAVAELRAGTLDVALGIPTEEAVLAANQDDALELVQRRFAGYTAAVFNTEAPHLHAGARSALSRSIDRQTLIRELFAGYAEVAVGPFVRHGPREAPGALAPYRRPAALRDLAAAFRDFESEVRILVPRGSRTMERLADIWSSDVREALAMRAEVVDFAELLGRVRSGAFEIALLSFTTSADVDVYNLFHSAEVGRGNLSRLQDAGVDRLLESLRNARSEDERRRLSHALSALLTRQAPFAFLTTDTRLGVVRKNVFGVGDAAPGYGARYFAKYSEVGTK